MDGKTFNTLDDISNVQWELLDDSHPRFNIWRCIGANGYSYKECFRKGVDPNDSHPKGLFGDEFAEKKGVDVSWKKEV